MPPAFQRAFHCVELEYKIRQLINEQERNGFTLDIQKAMLLVSSLKDKAAHLQEEVKQIFKPLPVGTRLATPKIKANGQLSSVGLRHIDNLAYVAGPHTVIEWEDFNLASRQQIVRQLMLRGWKPENFTEKGHAIVDETTLENVDIPEAKKIAEFLMLEKRIAQVESWLELVDSDSKVHGKVLTLRAISGRMAHNSPNMAQVPNSGAIYGPECRALWTVEKGYKLVGIDASGLELRMLAHYMNDDAYTNEVISGDIHTANQNAAGLETRNQAKTFIYAFLYGAGVQADRQAGFRQGIAEKRPRQSAAQCGGWRAGRPLHDRNGQSANRGGGVRSFCQCRNAPGTLARQEFLQGGSHQVVEQWRRQGAMENRARTGIQSVEVRWRGGAAGSERRRGGKQRAGPVGI